MILSDQEIMKAQTEHNIISDFNPDQVEPASYDLRLADKILLERNYSRPIGMNEEVEYIPTSINDRPLNPQEFVLGSTEEYILLPDNLAAFVTGKSTIGRKAIEVHQTAAWIDPGFQGNITLEIINNSSNKRKLKAGELIAQIVFFKVSGAVLEPYDGKYQNSDGVIGSLINKETEIKPLFIGGPGQKVNQNEI
jgi:dCTP deaminase